MVISVNSCGISLAGKAENTEFLPTGGALASAQITAEFILMWRLDKACM